MGSKRRRRITRSQRFRSLSPDRRAEVLRAIFAKEGRRLRRSSVNKSRRTRVGKGRPPTQKDSGGNVWITPQGNKVRFDGSLAATPRITALKTKFVDARKKGEKPKKMTHEGIRPDILALGDKMLGEERKRGYSAYRAKRENKKVIRIYSISDIPMYEPKVGADMSYHARKGRMKGKSAKVLKIKRNAKA